MTVGEALACGKPVIASQAVPWPALEDYRCGWRIRPGVPSLADAISEAMMVPDAQRAAMGRRGRLFVEQNYCWSKVSEAMLAVYEWVVGKGPRPCSVNEGQS